MRTWLNKITPDNYQKMETELRKLLFGDRKLRGEPGFELYVEPEKFEVD